MLRVAALVPYHTDYCAGQRFRVELWARHLRPRGIEIEILPFADRLLTDVLYKQGKIVDKAFEMLRCYVAQTARVLRAARPDVVFIYREAALLGPAVLERLAKRWNAPVVYDMDEPLFQSYRSPSNGYLNKLKFFGKYDELLALADRVWVVNDAIAAHARPIARAVDVVPMAVDTDRYFPRASETVNELRLGWTGTRTSQKNLEILAAPLRRLAAERGVSLRVLGDEPMTLPGVQLDFRPWSFEREVPELQDCSIGVVPVLRDEWSEWKFYFKLVQFMSLGLPVVASMEGSNREIIKEGANGLLARTEDEWYEKLKLLADDAPLRRELGRAARLTAVERFSLSGQLDFVERALKELT